MEVLDRDRKSTAESNSGRGTDPREFSKWPMVSKKVSFGWQRLGTSAL
jgi:hypothetical protein